MTYTSKIVVSEEDVRDWGCPYCGNSEHRNITYPSNSEIGGTYLSICSECDKSFLKLSTGVTEVNPQYIGANNFLTLVPHPRSGIPKRVARETIE